jgi:citrate synthase
MPGIGHRTHAEGDPRADTLFAIAKETGIYGKYCELLQALSKLATERRKRLIPVNVTGAIGAIALDMGFPWQITKAFALIGRTLGCCVRAVSDLKVLRFESCVWGLKAVRRIAPPFSSFCLHPLSFHLLPSPLSVVMRREF